MCRRPVRAFDHVHSAPRGLLPSLSYADHAQGLAIFVFDPLDTLQLRVHHERPALTGSEDGGVLSGHSVGRQPLVLPRRDVGIVREHRQRVQLGGHWDGDLTGEKR